MSTQLLVEVWSDIACPWCYVGKRRLEKALSRFAPHEHVEIVWRAFELDPSAPAVRDQTQSYAERLAKKYGTTPLQADVMIQRMVAVAAAEGLPFDFTRIRPGNTFDAHRLLHLARQHGKEGELKERFLRAYLCEGAPIGDHACLLQLSSEQLDSDAVQSVLSSDAYAAEVRKEQSDAHAIGVDGVPFFLIGRRYAVAGAQPEELLHQALTKAWDELAEGPVAVGGGEGPVCGPEGCA